MADYVFESIREQFFRNSLADGNGADCIQVISVMKVVLVVEIMSIDNGAP